VLSLTKSRLFYLAMVLVLTPKRCAKVVFEALALCIIALECELNQQASTFKEYEPGYLHIDVTYLPKLAGKKQYLFVAIDRATRVLYFERLFHLAMVLVLTPKRCAKVVFEALALCIIALECELVFAFMW
jgi:hypothetical protein